MPGVALDYNEKTKKVGGKQVDEHDLTFNPKCEPPVHQFAVTGRTCQCGSLQVETILNASKSTPAAPPAQFKGQHLVLEVPKKKSLAAVLLERNEKIAGATQAPPPVSEMERIKKLMEQQKTKAVPEAEKPKKFEA